MCGLFPCRVCVCYVRVALCMHGLDMKRQREEGPVEGIISQPAVQTMAVPLTITLGLRISCLVYCVCACYRIFLGLE